MKEARHHIEIDASGCIRRIEAGGHEYSPALGYTLFEVDGEIARVEHVRGESLRLAAGGASCLLSVEEKEYITFHVEPEVGKAGKPNREARGGPNAEKPPETAGVVLPFGLDAEFHLPEHRCTGRIIDRDMPLGESYSGGAVYNFLLVKLEDAWLRFMIDRPEMRKLRFEISRHPKAFLLTVTWPLESDLCVEFFPGRKEGLGAALESFKGYLRERFGVVPLKERKGVPEWIRDVPLVFTVDMLRSNGEICHDYDDVAGLAEELGKAGCPAGTLFYLPGWNADYDAGYPTYRPHDDLGGEERFRRMVEALHGRGYRLMVHTNPGGVDPSHPEFHRFEPLLRRKPDGSLSGWQLGPGEMPPSKILKFRTGRIPLETRKDGGGWIAETVEIPDHCAALMRMGGIGSGADGIRITIGRRSQVIPAGGADSAEGHAFPYGFALAPGRNPMKIELLGGSQGTAAKGWYEITCCYRYPDPYAPWTYPIQDADTSRSEWIEIFVGELERAVWAYGIDAIHMDAANLTRPYDNHALFHALRDRLPGTAIGGEWCATMEDVGYWAICQGAPRSLIANTENAKRTRDCNSTPPRAGLEELYAWLDEPSPVCAFAREYFVSYLHLCAADAFVPVGKVCNILPERKMPLADAELWTVLRNAKRYGAIPNLRVNFRKYGLDGETRKAVVEIAGGT